MIYICKGCVNICAAPFKLCEGCCKCCSDFFKPILDQPLGGFVVITWIVMLVQSLCAVIGLISGGCGQIKVFSFGLIAFAVMHCFGAYYLQRRLVTNLQKSGSTATGTALAKEAGRMFLYDVGFCIYSIVFVISFCYALFCFTQTDCDNTKDDNSFMFSMGALVMVLHCIGATSYGVCWYFGNCCLGGLQGGRGGGGGAVQYPPAAPIGMQVGPR
jgi:hypothetical protein